MSHSIWQLSGLHRVRWLPMWSCLVFLGFCFVQNSPVDAGTSGPAQIKLQGAAYPTPEPASAAGQFIVDTVAVFDFNSTQTAVYGDNEPAGPADNATR